MGEHLLWASLLLAYGPFALMLGLYVAALVLKLAGRPELLTVLVTRTGPQEPVKRASSDGPH